jgi:hypothetical protein
VVVHCVSQDFEQLSDTVSVQLLEHVSTYWALQLIDPELHSAEQSVSKEQLFESWTVSA